MSSALFDTIHLFTCASRGIKADIDKSIDFNQVYQIATKQNVWSIIFPIVQELYESGSLKINETAYEKLNKDYLKTYTFQYKRRKFIKNLFSQLREKGIEFCLLKGDSLSMFYNEPLSRISSDVDIKIDKADMLKCSDLLRTNQYDVEPLYKGTHHFECVHPVYGLLEAHVSFYTDRANDICFDNIEYNRGYSKINIPEIGEVNILEYTDGYIFLLMHYIKHFISTGAGIRQIMDIVFYLESYESKIDFNYVNSVLKKLGYEEFYQSLLNIGKLYFMSEICGKYITREIEEEKLVMILEDIEKGGIFGFEDEGRNGFYDHYLSYRLGKEYDNKKYKNSLFRKIFPPADSLKMRYTYLGKTPALYPVAVVHKLIDNVKFVISKKNKTEKIDIESINKRLEFLNKIGL